ncbi:MAG: IS110 family transposase [Verrucomicrobia bacterium]|nr:IS110 family transposase [Verrucomicrobiota bacterium]
MRKVIMVGCDLHDASMILKIAVDRNAPETKSVKNDPQGRQALAADLRRRAQAEGGARVIFAYEASGQGFGLYDELTAAGVECCVLAPTKMARSRRQRSEKNDDKDALWLLELLRGHILAGNRLPTVWIPDAATRDDRELVGTRMDVGEKITGLKAQVQCLLKRNQLRRPAAVGRGWTKTFRVWLQQDLIVSAESPLAGGTRAALSSLLRQLGSLEEEEMLLDAQVDKLAWSSRYAAQTRATTRLCGVGVLTAMVFLTEMGDLGRFANRRQIAAYLGLAPTCHESGEKNDCKGHITHQGSSRVRRVLCQATWARVRNDEEEKAAYERIKARNPKKKKIAVVASMRRLAIRLWHLGRGAQYPAAENQSPGRNKTSTDSSSLSASGVSQWSREVDPVAWSRELSTFGITRVGREE